MDSLKVPEIAVDDSILKKHKDGFEQFCTQVSTSDQFNKID